MLKPAILHESELQRIFAEIQYDERYKYYWNYSYRDKFKASESTWSRHEYVSMTPDGTILGYMGYDINRNEGIAHNLCIISFTEDSMIFAKDLARFLRDIFEKFNFRKLRWNVCVGNPVEKHYDRLCERYGGRIVGYWLEEDKLFDGTYADRKMYEIHRDAYFFAIGRK